MSHGLKSFVIYIKNQTIIWPKVTRSYQFGAPTLTLRALQVQWQLARPSLLSVRRLLRHQRSVVTEHRGDVFTQQLQSKGEWIATTTDDAIQPLKRMCVSAWIKCIAVRFYIIVATTLATARQRQRVNNTKWDYIMGQNRQNVSRNEQEWTSMCLKWSDAVIALPLCSVANGDEH